ncbi:hypothetical protein SAMN02787142_1247 [Burkholderia sp. WP9]|uniref:hypothetical protein n=1 Tax=Burkholderiaceae TaxID=119060 RepID=UPI0008978A9B|nr:MULTISPECIES: hypothetical protein [Burkholderiaceae]MBK3741176.1 hypothetical protein [Paraburkholderia aspalathi]CAE6746631.1 hypothetical protein R69619_02728 [Paraburkholderia nemoris]SEC35472.1 hypothetical protein SAMN02787142_1247 [Burkholderia sp. WP9]
MGLFTMPGGSDPSTDDSGSTDATSGDGALSSLFGLNDVGSGYGVTTYTDPPPTTSVAGDLGSLQSGSTATPTIDLTTAFADTLGTIVAIDSINSQASTTGIGYYKAANGQVYAVGTGPGPGSAVVSAMPGNLLFWLLIIGGAVLFAKEEKL